MADEPDWWPSPDEFRGTFAGFIEAVERGLRDTYQGDAGEYESVEDRAAAEAPITAAQIWLVERWGSRYPCPVCRNTEWSLSEVAPAVQPEGFLSFFITCEYCANTMQIVPGLADQDEPILPDEQLHFPAPEQ